MRQKIDFSEHFRRANAASHPDRRAIPCSGCGRSRRKRSMKIAVLVPTFAASLRNAWARVCLALVGLGHMFIDGDVARALRALDVAGDTLVVKEDLDCPIRQPDIYAWRRPSVLSTPFVHSCFLRLRGSRIPALRQPVLDGGQPDKYGLHFSADMLHPL